MERARRKFALMHELGCDTMLLCSNVQPDCSADVELQIADLRALAELAEQEQIRIGYEALAWAPTSTVGIRPGHGSKASTVRRWALCSIASTCWRAATRCNG